MAVCSSCATEIAAGTEVVARGQGRSAPQITLCQSCATKIDQSYQVETEEPNFFGALLLGLGAAVVGSVAWYTAVTLSKYQIGLLAIAVGWLVAQGVFIGAGRKRGLPLQLLSVAITLAAMLGSEYAIARYLVIQQLIAEGYEVNFPLLPPPSQLVTFMIEWIKAEPMTLFFWGLAMFEAFVIPSRRSLRRVR